MLSTPAVVLDSPLNWAVVTTHPHREKQAIDNLLRQDFVAYCPLIRKRVRHARRIRDVLRPLFPGYAFVGSRGAQWRLIQSTLGVRALVRFGDQPGYIDGAFIDDLKAREIDGAIVAASSNYKLGQNVRMVDGVFDGLIAKIIEMDEKNRLVVLMDFLNRPVRVRIDETLVAAL